MSEAFLSFAYPHFILDQKQTDDLDLLKWEQMALTYPPTASLNDIDRDSLLLFFAELCFQQRDEAQEEEIAG